MKLDYNSAQESYDYIVKNFGKQDLIVVYISELETSGEYYEKLAEILDVDVQNDKKITTGFYVYESDEETTKQQKVYVNVVGADIILDISIDGNSTFTFDEIWDLKKTTTDACIDWGDGIKNSEISHTYSSPFEGTIKIYGYGIVQPKYSGNYYTETTTKKSIKSVNFITPQVMERVNTLFASCTNLTSVTGSIYLTETNSKQMNVLFYNCPSLTSLKGFTIYWGSSYVMSLYGLFQNCSKVTDETLRQLKIVNLNLDEITDCSKLFSGSLITKIPTKLVSKNAQKIDGICDGCRNLTYIPSGIFENVVYAHRAFYDSGVTDVAADFSLPKLIKGGAMFSGCKLPWQTIVKIYNALPITENAPETAPSTREDTSDYTIVFGFINGEENNIQTELGIDSFPKAGTGQYIKASNGWWISFDNG